MKLELKNIKHYPAMSEETEAFNANLYVNGKFIATAENSGKGGSTNIRVNDPNDTESTMELMSAMKWAKTVPHNYTFENSLDQLVDELLSKALTIKQIKKYFTKNLVWQEPDNENEVAMVGWNLPISDMITNPKGVEIIQKKVDELETKGFKILNNNFKGLIKIK